MKGIIEKMKMVFNHKNNMLAFILVIVVFQFVWIFFKKDLITNTLTDFIASFAGFILTALGFSFVVVQISALAEQIQNEKERSHQDKERHYQDSEFRNFLEATKMLTSADKDNVTAQISAMYLLYDFAKKYPDNLEKVMKVLNRYVIPSYYEIISNEKRTIDEWKENGDPCQQVASIALELNKKLFIYALQEVDNKIINLSGLVIFNLDFESDINFDKNLVLSKIFEKSDRITFLHSNFSSKKQSKQIDFFTTKKVDTDSIIGRMNISLSNFIKCDLTNCNFSQSNLWGVSFENCILEKTSFENAECEGAEFIGTTEIKCAQLNEMLFLSKLKFNTFRACPELKYGVIYHNNPNCFQYTEEYRRFKNS
ncbi:putative low-complexity protein [Beggiatoa alba B18LD]|uniref:Putative low-complexity protein n=1 Tax=Beggiatoa alba B18LD TaxID=395493 RepID=I3CIX1_9GAMM|nr:pentapeptide repeat-containing protein [Beggiatoa alba]EIJ43564.1 putative low-complexity protein [Beggiatoa alba B18LD]